MYTTVLILISKQSGLTWTFPDRSAAHFQCTEVHTSVHFGDTLLLKCIALHSKVHCTRPRSALCFTCSVLHFIWSILISLHTLHALSSKCLMPTLKHISLQYSVHCTYTAMRQCACSICTPGVLQCTEVLHCKALPMHCRCAAFRSGLGNQLFSILLSITAVQSEVSMTQFIVSLVIVAVAPCGEQNTEHISTRLWDDGQVKGRASLPFGGFCSTTCTLWSHRGPTHRNFWNFCPQWYIFPVILA